MKIVRILRPISLRMISAMQLKKNFRKGCQIFAIMVNDLDGEDPMRETSDHLILQEYANFFQVRFQACPQGGTLI